MREYMVVLRRFVVDAKGQDLIEYGLLVGLIALVALVAVTAVGTTINDLFWSVIADGLSAAA